MRTNSEATYQGRICCLLHRDGLHSAKRVVHGKKPLSLVRRDFAASWSLCTNVAAPENSSLIKRLHFGAVFLFSPPLPRPTIYQRHEYCHTTPIVVQFMALTAMQGNFRRRKNGRLLAQRRTLVGDSRPSAWPSVIRAFPSSTFDCPPDCLS
jgi:hypothetical protein